MNHKEIEDLVILAKKGNTQALIKILELYKSFLFKTAAKYNLKGMDIYDLVQIGYIALIHAVEKYKPGTRTFSSYAFTTVKNAFNESARKFMKCPEELSLNLPVDSEDDCQNEYINCLESMENLEEEILESERDLEIRKAVSKLPPEDMELIIMVYFSRISLRTYAKKKGMHYLMAVRKRDKALEKLNKYLKKFR